MATTKKTSSGTSGARKRTTKKKAAEGAPAPMPGTRGKGKRKAAGADTPRTVALWGQVYEFPRPGFVCVGPDSGTCGVVYDTREAASKAATGDRRVIELRG